jgi:hypothetical protein
MNIFSVTTSQQQDLTVTVCVCVSCTDPRGATRIWKLSEQFGCHTGCRGFNCSSKCLCLSFNMTQSRVVTGLLTGHNTLRRHLHLVGLTGSVQQRRPQLMFFCECEALATLRHTYVGSLFLDTQDIRCLILGAI